MNSTERDLPEDKLRERLLGIVAGPNPALTPRQRAAIRDAADALASIRAERDAAVEALGKASQLAEIARDWNLDEVEIDGQMVTTFSLKAEFERARAIAGEQTNDA